ncbi:hypothetical protein [Phocaeicola sp.]
MQGKYKPVIACDNFCKEIQFQGNKEELYMLCCYILGVVSDIYFFKLRPTAKDVNDELDKMDEVVSVTFTDKTGKSITVNTESIVREVLDAVKADRNDTAYETDKLCKITDVADTTYLQSMFAMELATFINSYFPVKRRKDSLVSVSEQELIMKILYLFKLTPAKATNNRFRQLMMLYKSFKPNVGWAELSMDGIKRVLPLAFIKWKQCNSSNWQTTEYEKNNIGDTVTFKGM